MEKLIRVGIFFSTLNTSSDEFRNFKKMVDLSVMYDDIVNMMNVFKAWRRDNIVRACLHMIAIRKLDDLRPMWVAKFRVDIYKTCVSFRRICYS